MFLSYSDSTKRVSDVLKVFDDGEMNRFCQGDVSGTGDVLKVFDDGEMNRFCQGDVSGTGHSFLNYLSTGIPNFWGFLWAHFLLSPL